MNRIFLLSPARCGGKRGSYLMRETGTFDLALKVQSPDGAPLGEVMAFMSGLYFRGKLAYAQAFANPPDGQPGAVVITPNRGLVPAVCRVGVDDLRSFATVDIDPREPAFRKPLERDAGELANRLGENCEAVLLGSVASGKYVEILLAAFGGALRFPSDFVGRGDMSRGGLMLRAAEDGRELPYVPVAGAVRHGPRPPKLPPLKRTAPRTSFPRTPRVVG